MIDVLTTTDAEYKDAHPMDTVNRIKDILRLHNIETVEEWNDSYVPNCYSLRVNIVGTKIGTNGKGVTKEFALASGYGEFMERLQLGNIWRNKMSFDKGVSSADAQSEYVQADDLLARNSKWYERFAQSLHNLTGITMTPKQIMERYVEKDGSVLSIPYYCPTTGQMEHLPLDLVKSVYGSNGGAAGNTIEEAIVQAISEIVERNHELRVIYGNIPVPEIPEDVLRTCTIAYKTILFLRESGYRVTVKDCSLGTKFPVVCVTIINTATGKYHTHFGAHPNFEIALQRTLTESFQGRNMQTVTKFENFCYTSNETYDFRHYLGELIKGTSEKMPQFFIRKPDAPYTPTAGFSGSNNRQCLQECLDFFREQGYDVLIRDCSCLGFPTCQVIIPGYSEIVAHRFSPKYNNYRYRSRATRALRNPTAVGVEDLLGLIMHVMESSKYRFYGMEGFANEAGLYANLPADVSTYLMNAAMGYAYYALGKYKETINCVGKMLSVKEPRDAGYLICLKRYLTMLINGYSPEDIKQTLLYFHTEQTVAQLYDCLNKKENPLHQQVLRCDMQCTPDCVLYNACKKTHTDRIAKMIVEKSKQMDQSTLVDILK